MPSDGGYEFLVRVAGKNDTSLDVLVDGSYLATSDVPNTGGWQDWTTVSGGDVTLDSGTHVFRVEPNGDSFNINWFGFDATDTTTPTAPPNLSASNVTETSVDLSWDASSDSGTGLDHSNVYRDGTVVTQVAAGTTATTVGGLSSNTTYDFYVTAVDGASNESDPSNTVTVTTDQEIKTVEVTGNGADNYNGGSTVRYIVETSGTIESAGTGDLESEDREGGSEAAGRVPADGSDTDTYSLTGGKVTDVSTWGGEVTVTVTVDGTTWSG